MKRKIVAVMLAAALAMAPAMQILAEDIVLEAAEEIFLGTEEYENLTETAENEEIEEKQTDTEIECDSEMNAQDDSELSQAADVGEETISFEDEVTVLSVEEITDYASGSETEILTDEVSGEVQQSGLSTNASPYLLRTFAETVFDTCYGNQLDGTARTVYDAMVTQYVNNGQSGELTIEFSDPVTFQTLGTPNGSGGLIWSSSENAEYQEKISYSMQAAYDAFIYDYPQVFWMNTFYYSTSVSFSGGQGSYTGKVSKIRLNPVETYEGASGEISEFKNAAAAAVADLEVQSDTSRYEIVKKIHDYLCEKLEYGDTSSAYAHSAAGAFLKGGAVVCEGYAKAFKILCNEFGMECVLIVGIAGEGHMWNYVRMEDGNWYLVDLTWDDQSKGTDDTYLLAGNSTIGYDGVSVGEERTVYTNFSSAVYTNYFTVPILSDSAYSADTAAHTHTWQVTEEKEPTCQEDGYCISVCSGCQETSKVILEKNVTTTTVNGEVVENPIHRFEDGLCIDNNDATCTTDGTCTLLCDYGCGTAGGKIVVQGSAKGHKFETYVSNNDATFYANGTKTATCANGCGSTKTVTDSGTKVKLNVSTLKLQKGKSTSKVKVIGLPSGVKVKKWKSSNTKICTVTSKGKIKAKKVGTAYLTVTIGNGKWTSSKMITVKVQKGVVKTTGISLAKKSVTLKKGKKHTITATVTPITSGQKLTYTSSNKKVATVSAKGVVTAKGIGTAKITVKSGSKTVKLKVTVKK